MISKYFTIALRNLGRHKFYAFLNILGLSVGIAFCILITKYIVDEKKVNTSLRNIERQYHLQSNWKVENMGLALTTTAPLARALKENYPNLVQNYYRLQGVRAVMSAGNKHIRELISIGDSTLLTMYGFPLLYGNAETALKEVNSVVITEAIALNLFDRKNVLNEVLTISTPSDGKHDYIVTGVLKEVPRNTVTDYNAGSHTQVFIPMANTKYFSGGQQADKDWASIYTIGFIELKPGVGREQLEKPIAQILQTHAPEAISKNLSVALNPLSTYYLNDNNGLVRRMITSLSLIAVFILIMAIINFINISIGTANYRLKEIGLRKMFGSKRSQLIIQHITESIAITLVATLVALGLYELLRPSFNSMLNVHLEHIWYFGLFEVGFLVTLIILVGFLAGVYPAFILTAAPYVTAVKGKLSVSRGGAVFRKGLLITEFVVAVFVFLCTLNISAQVSYFFERDLGYKKEQVMVLNLPRQWDSAGVARMELVRNDFLKLPSVSDVSLSYVVPDGMSQGTMNVYAEGKPEENAVAMEMLSVDEHFSGTYQLKQAAGKFFEGNVDLASVVLTETAAKMIGIAGDPIGKIVRFKGSSTPFTVRGIVKDFNFGSMHSAIKPMLFIHVKAMELYRYFSVRLSTDQYAQSLKAIEQTWRSRFPEEPFDYFFMDDKFASLYTSELQLKKASVIATALNILIILLGTIGVVSFSLVRRLKEIATRKVLGATTGSIISLFLKEYLYVLIFANIIAWPLAWLFINNWLKNYTYRIDINLFNFILVGLITLAATFLLISVQCFKTASANPARFLRRE